MNQLPLIRLLDYWNIFYLDIYNVGEVLTQFFCELTTLHVIKGIFNRDQLFFFFETVTLWSSNLTVKKIFHPLNLDHYLVTYNHFFDNFKGNWFYALLSESYNNFVIEAIWKSYAQTSSTGNLIILSDLTLNAPIQFIFMLFGKKFLIIYVLGLSYFFTTTLKPKYQYNFNFYFSYFKTIADLSEQEYGSFDDFKFFLYYMLQILLTFCWVYIFSYIFIAAKTKVIAWILINLILVLTLPIKLLWHFGLSFNNYIRGSANTSNILIEFFFDFIALTILIMRFVIQNIRFVFVFLAFMELFEWTYSSTELFYILCLKTQTIIPTTLQLLNLKFFFYYFLSLLKTILLYFYYFLHLVFISFTQIFVYFMVSFWLFFFLYTTFVKETYDVYFCSKRN